ncbi:MAG TPA: radical SAM/SPASM domain-containing protein [Myxococcota bacterium]|nr:radical SAM/SPASM domain-containing protein [Myxococcota bacterium]
MRATREMETPRLVAIETTNRCNARCSFCPNNALQRDRSTMDSELFEKIVTDCAEFELPAIEPFLQGEPFVDKHIFDRLELLRSRLPRTKLRLYSNGAALVPSKIDRLRGFGVDHLYISLNTIVPERYSRIVGLPFERTMENLCYLADRKAGKVARSVSVRLTMTEETTWMEKLRFLDLCRRLGVRPMLVGLFNYKGDIHSDLPVPGFPCEHITRLDIMVDGRTTLCCMDQEGEFGWGSVRDKSVLEVYNSDQARRVRALHREGRRAEYDPCNRCNLFWSDLNGVPWPRRALFWGQIVGYHLRYHPLI